MNQSNRGSGRDSTIGPYQTLKAEASIVHAERVDDDMFAA